MSALTEKISRWLDANAPLPCIVCGCNERVLERNSPVAVLPAPNGQECAVVVVICARCAHIELYSATRMGIKPEEVKR
jgi:predicted nucleic-acid-binding Zn-ribbon protein